MALGRTILNTCSAWIIVNLLGGALVSAAPPTLSSAESPFLPAPRVAWQPQQTPPGVLPQPEIDAKELLPEERPIQSLGISIAPQDGLLPTDYAAKTNKFQDDTSIWVGENRGWAQYTQLWCAPNIYSRPLYFEEVSLERHGQSKCACLQPLVSGAHFFGNTIALPYHMSVNHPHECVYALGHHRPGDCIPYHHYHPEWSAKAATVEAAVITGLIFLLP